MHGTIVLPQLSIYSYQLGFHTFRIRGYPLFGLGHFPNGPNLLHNPNLEIGLTGNGREEIRTWARGSSGFSLDRLRVGNSLFGFSCESLVVWERKSIKSDLLFYKEREEQWRTFHSFVLGIKKGKAGRKERIWSFLFNAHSLKERISLLLFALSLF